MATMNNWSKLINLIYDDKEVACPECGGDIRTEIYSNDGEIGFAILTCSDCNKSVKLSRIKIPNGVETKKF